MKPETAIRQIEAALRDHKRRVIDAGECLELIAIMVMPSRIEALAEGAGDAGRSVSAHPAAAARRDIDGAGFVAAPGDPMDIDNPDAAMMAVMGDMIRDFQQGKVSRDDALKMLERRRDVIRQTRAETPKPAQPCAECGEPGTAIVGGASYCANHAETAPRALPERFLQ